MPRVGACFLGLLGLALPKWVKALVDGKSGTVSSDDPPPPFDKYDVFGVEVSRVDEFNKSGALGSSSTIDFGSFGRSFRP